MNKIRRKQISIVLEPVKGIKGLGRWVYCKYCYKHVQPALSGFWQIVCPECNSGLTPDFLTEQELKDWISDK